MAQHPEPCDCPSVIAMAYTRTAPNPMVCYTRQAYAIALSRLGYRLQTQFIPPARATLMLSNNQIDGDLSRVHDYDSLVSNIVRVEEPHLETGFAAYSRKAVARTDWEGLRRSGLSLVYMRGVALARKELGSLDQNRIHSAATAEEGLSMVANGRADVFVGLDWLADRLLEREYANHGIRKAGMVQPLTMHAFFHESHAELAKRISKTLREMKDEGVLDQLAKECDLRR